jgi:maleylpyruvate isomerase
VRVGDRPSPEIEGCRGAHERMAAILASVSDDEVQRPSRLPGWSVAHVITHLARNAEAMHRRIDGATRGELVEQYAGGAAGRAAAIEAGAARSPVAIVEDAISWAARLDDIFATLPDHVWTRPVRTVGGDDHPVAVLPFRRWREVELHLVDLGLGYTAADWSQDLIDRVLPGLVARLIDRADARDLMAWLLGRGSPPELEPWG